MSFVDDVIDLWRTKGGSNYGSEPVTQLEHALQTATLAKRAGANDELIAAALLHDVGHLLHDLPDDAPESGIDDRHEIVGYNWLARHFGPGVSEPVRLHVAAKRFLCSTDPNYAAELSEPSRISLALQGGLMTPEEVEEFRSLAEAETATQLRRWDDEAKIVGWETPGLDDFRPHLENAYAKGHHRKSHSQ